MAENEKKKFGSVGDDLESAAALTDFLGNCPEADRPTVEKIYGEFRKIAGYLMNRQRAGHTLQATALANEVWIRLQDSMGLERFENSPMFYSLAHITMRCILIDHARKRSRTIEGRSERAPLEVVDPADNEGNLSPEELIDLCDALSRLAGTNPRAAAVTLMCRLYGATHREAAEVFRISETMIAKDLGRAQAWLRWQLGPSFGRGSNGTAI